jgi:SsrA-binding protein
MGIKIITKNKRAYYDYHVEQKFEAGLVLQGTEVKSLRAGKCTMGESHVGLDKHDEAWVYNMNIAHYEFGNIANHQEDRKRKLLLNRKELLEIKKGLTQKGLTVIPLSIYFKGSRAKLEIGLAKGKKLFDKRQDQAKKDIEKKLRQKNYE